MCSGGKVQQNDQALQDANLAANTNFLNDAKTSFSEQQAIQAKQTLVANNMITNPMGYTNASLAIQRTGVNENFARAAKNAIGSAAAAGARYGSADIGGGPTGAMAGQIATEASLGKAGALSSIDANNEALKRENMMAGIQELNQAGGAAQGAVGGSTTGAGTTGGDTVNAGSGVLAAKESGYQEVGSVLGAVGGLVTAGAGIPGVQV
jgi:hypothetical protein